MYFVSKMQILDTKYSNLIKRNNADILPYENILLRTVRCTRIKLKKSISKNENLQLVKYKEVNYEADNK